MAISGGIDLNAKTKINAEPNSRILATGAGSLGVLAIELDPLAPATVNQQINLRGQVVTNQIAQIVGDNVTIDPSGSPNLHVTFTGDATVQAEELSVHIAGLVGQIEHVPDGAATLSVIGGAAAGNNFEINNQPINQSVGQVTNSSFPLGSVNYRRGRRELTGRRRIGRRHVFGRTERNRQHLS